MQHSSLVSAIDYDERVLRSLFEGSTMDPATCMLSPPPPPPLPTQQSTQDIEYTILLCLLVDDRSDRVRETIDAVKSSYGCNLVPNVKILFFLRGHLLAAHHRNVDLELGQDQDLDLEMGNGGCGTGVVDCDVGGHGGLKGWDDCRVDPPDWVRIYGVPDDDCLMSHLQWYAMQYAETYYRYQFLLLAETSTYVNLPKVIKEVLPQLHDTMHRCGNNSHVHSNHSNDMNLNLNLNHVKNQTASSTALYVGGHGGTRTVQGKPLYYHDKDAGVLLSRACMQRVYPLLRDVRQWMETWKTVCRASQAPAMAAARDIALGFMMRTPSVVATVAKVRGFYACNYLGYPCHPYTFAFASIYTCGNMNPRQLIHMMQIAEHNQHFVRPCCDTATTSSSSFSSSFSFSAASPSSQPFAENTESTHSNANVNCSAHATSSSPSSSSSSTHSSSSTKRTQTNSRVTRAAAKRQRIDVGHHGGGN